MPPCPSSCSLCSSLESQVVRGSVVTMTQDTPFPMSWMAGGKDKESSLWKGCAAASSILHAATSPTWHWHREQHFRQTQPALGPCSQQDTEPCKDPSLCPGEWSGTAPKTPVQEEVGQWLTCHQTLPLQLIGKSTAPLRWHFSLQLKLSPECK